MKVLVATSRTQGARTTDYHWCVEGELVWVQHPCDRDLRRDPHSCGCGRGFAGLASHRATTTAMVKEIAWITLDVYVEALRESFEAGGWPTSLAHIVGVDQAIFASAWPAGTILERDIEVFTERIQLSGR